MPRRGTKMARRAIVTPLARRCAERFACPPIDVEVVAIPPATRQLSANVVAAIVT